MDGEYQQAGEVLSGGKDLNDAGQDGSGGKGSWNSKRFLKSLLVAILFTAVVAVGALVMSRGEKPDLSYNTLDYDVTVQANGDMRIKQRIDIRLLARENKDGDEKPWRQLFQRYTLNKDKLTGISDISVKDVTAGREYGETSPITPSDVSDTPNWDGQWANKWYLARVNGIDLLPYHYEQGKFGCEQFDSNCQVELGWNIPEIKADEHRVFEVSMTFHGVVTAHADVASFQWEPFGRRNETSIGRVNGTVHLPQGVTQSNSKAWLHFSGTSQTSRDKDGTLHFTAFEVVPYQHLDVVSTFDVGMTHDVARRDPNPAGNDIAASEDNQEATARKEAQEHSRSRLVYATTIILIGIIISLVLIRLAFSSYKASQYQGGTIYRRDPPDLSPAAAGAINDVISDASTGRSGQMAATMLSLASKGAISIYPGCVSDYQGDGVVAQTGGLVAKLGSMIGKKQDDKTSTVAINPVCSQARPSLNLSPSEDSALCILEAAAAQLGDGVNVFDLKQMSKVLQEDPSNSENLMVHFNNSVDAEVEPLHATRNRVGRNLLAGITLLLCIFFVIMLAVVGKNLYGLYMTIIPIMSAVFSIRYGHTLVLTPQGQQWAGQVEGLKRYMLDFSEFADRGTQDLVLWGRYLVYAAAFGISDKVMQQLAQAYPQITDRDWLDSNANGSLIYQAYHSSSSPGGWSRNGFGDQAGLSPTSSMPTSFAYGFDDLGSQLTASFADIQHTISATYTSGSSGGSFSGGGFSGSSGGSGGGSFGGR